MIASLLGMLFVSLIGLVWLGVIVYLIILAGRLVKAVERIADKLEAQAPRQSPET